jgi:fatty acid desaturase
MLYYVSMSTSLVPDVAVRPEVLPTDRLLKAGVARPELRARLRKISNVGNALSVGGLWAFVIGVLVAACWIDTWWAYLVAFLAMGPVFVRLAILMHEAAHRLLFSRRKVNDWVGTWLLAYPAWTPIGLYRRGHMSHHREEFGAAEPDLAFYDGYRCGRKVLMRRLVRDAVGISGWKNMAALVKATGNPKVRRVAVSILSVQGALWAAMWSLSGRWWLYLALWWLPWMTEWRVLNRLRAIAEHGGLAANDDRRATTHCVRQTWLARLWLVPYNSGWHLAHHVDMGVPWRNLPEYHDELVRAGYITPDLCYPNYLALWSALSSGDGDGRTYQPNVLAADKRTKRRMGQDG